MSIPEYGAAISFLIGWVGEPIAVPLAGYRGLKGDNESATFFMVVAVFFQGFGK